MPNRNSMPPMLAWAATSATAAVRSAGTTLGGLQRLRGTGQRRGGGRRRLVRRSTRHAAGRTRRAAAALDGLLVADRRRCGAALVRLELLEGGFGLREVELGGHGGAQVVAADQGFEQLVDALAVAALDLVGVLQLLRVERAGVVGVAAGQQRTGLVEHADGPRVHLGHAGGDQVHDAGDLRTVQRAAGVQREHHRGGRLLLFAKEAVLVRQREVHAGVLYRGQRGDRAHQLAFQPALERQPFLELGLAEACRVHHLEAAHGTLGQAGRGELQAHVVHLVRGHQDCAAAVGMSVGHVHLRELGDDGAAVLVGQVGVEHLVVAALAAVERQREQDRGDRGDAEGQAQLVLQRQCGQAATESGGLHQRQRGGVSGSDGNGVVHGLSANIGGVTNG